MELSPSEKAIVANVFKPASKLGKTASTIFTAWIIATLFLACYLADGYILLVWFYGFIRVHKEGLHFINGPRNPKRAEDLDVSNGDHISYTNSLISLPITLVLWLTLVLIGYFVIKQVSHWRKNAVYNETLKKISTS